MRAEEFNKRFHIGDYVIYKAEDGVEFYCQIRCTAINIGPIETVCYLTGMKNTALGYDVNKIKHVKIG